MQNEKESTIVAVVNTFTNVLDSDKQMYVLGFMQGVQAERATQTAAAEQAQPEKKAG